MGANAINVIFFAPVAVSFAFSVAVFTRPGPAARVFSALRDGKARVKSKKCFGNKQFMY